MMQLENRFTVPVPVEEAWAVLLDVERIAPCMPGAKLLSASEDEFEGSMRVKLGPMTVTYTGTARLVERDEETRRAVIQANGKEARGAGTAKATVTTQLVPRGETTDVELLTDFAITGKPAQFGRGVMADVAERLVDRFAARLAEEIAPAPDDHGAGPKVEESPGAAAQSPTAAPVAAGRPEDDALDLWDVAGGAVVKRLAPVAAVAVLLVLLARRLRRR